MNKKMGGREMLKKSLFIILIFIVFLAMKTPSAVFAQATISPSDIDKSRSLTMLQPNETVLSDYREKDDGMFSNMWAVYILSEGEGEKKDWFIELNGKRIGPFENNSDLISFSPNGKQVVFAAKEKADNKWSVYVNGVKRWSYDGLAWATYTWPLGLKGDTIRSQSRAVVFEQSNDNKLVSFFSYRKEGDKTLWANVSNGKEGRYYKDIDTNITFINGKSAYWAWKSDDAKYFVVGNEEYGPYNKAYSIKFSDNKEHFAFIAESNGKNILVLDGKEILMPGEIETHALGNDGNYAVAYTQKGSVYVLQNGVTWPKTYSETVWHQFRMTPDGKKLAGWFKQDGKWYVVVNGKTEYGPYESYYYVKAGEIYSLFLGKSGENVAYFTRLIEGNSTGSEFYLNGKRIKNDPSFGGISITVYQDDSGSIVGVGLLGAVEADMVAIADAAAVGADNPIEAKYFGSRLVYTKKKGDLTYVVEYNKEFGPFVDAGFFCSSPTGKHYGYIAENQNGKWVVVDGKYQSPYYDSIYKLQFAEENEVAFLTVKNGKVVRVFSTIK
jgi:hypothetical protein